MLKATHFSSLDSLSGNAQTSEQLLCLLPNVVVGCEAFEGMELPLSDGFDKIFTK